MQKGIFVKSATDPVHYPGDSLPEVAFAGRSNVGKSSLINALVGQRGLAHTSNTPGRTRLINFYRIRERFSFVDLPGYGYARVPLAMKQSWGAMVEAYLKERRSLKIVILIMDIRRDPTADDLTLRAWLGHHGIPVTFVLTKVDKLSRNQMLVRERQIRGLLELPAGEEPVLFSAKTGMGKEVLWKGIEKALQ